ARAPERQPVGGATRDDVRGAARGLRRRRRAVPLRRRTPRGPCLDGGLAPRSGARDPPSGRRRRRRGRAAIGRLRPTARLRSLPMAGILVVCSGNICRSPIAEGLLRRALERRLDRAAPPVGSAGTIAVDGAPAMPESIEAARERGADIGAHAARHLTRALVDDADLIVGMAAEHREAVGRLSPGAAARTFTLRELTRLLEARTASDPEPSLQARVGEAAAARA